MLEYTWLHFRSHSFLECDSTGIQPQRAQILTTKYNNAD